MRPSINGRRIIVALLLMAGAIQIVRHCVGTFALVQGDSMFPTFNANNLVRARPLHGAPQRGDVVIITDDRGDRVMKRIIGLPGETVTVYRGFVYINRQRINEPYLPRRTYTFNRDEIIGRPPSWLLGADEYFLLGDNRSKSHDSRYFGPVKRQQVRQVVRLPDKAERPVFCGIMLIGSGSAAAAKFSPGREPVGQPHPVSNVKI